MFEKIKNNLDTVAQFSCDNYPTIRNLTPQYNLTYRKGECISIIFEGYDDLSNSTALIIKINFDDSIKIYNDRVNETNFKNFILSIDRQSKIDKLV